MIERRARFIDRLLEEHDKVAPECAASRPTLYERSGQKEKPDNVHCRVSSRCAGCGRSWEWTEIVATMLDDGRRVREPVSA